MNNIVKNLSKILALTTLFANFSPMVLASSDGDPAFDSSQMFSSPMSTNDTYEPHLATLQDKINHELTKLATYNVFATDEFKAKVDLDIQWRILHQLNVLFEKYPLFAIGFNCFLAIAPLPKDAPNVQHNRFEIDIITNDKKGEYLGGRMSIWHRYMKFCCTGANADRFKDHIKEFGKRLPTKLPTTCSVEFQVAHEFGHCVQELYCALENIKYTPETIQAHICKVLGSDVRRRLGRRWCQPSTRGKPTLQAEEFFADFFAYVQCGADVPKKYETLLADMIKKWTPIQPT